MYLQRVETEYNSADAECAAKHHYNKKEVVPDTHNIHNLRLLKCELKSSPLKILYGEMHKLQMQHGIELLLKGVKAYNDELCYALNNNNNSNQHIKSEYCKNVECFERWLDVCDGVNFTDSYGNTLLHWACAVGYVDAAKVLLRAGLLSSLEACNVNGATPLLCAAATATNAEAMIQFLISHGANTEVHTSRSASDTLQSLLSLRNMRPIYERIIESCESLQERAEWNEKCGLYVENIMSFANKLGTREAAREFVYFHQYNSQQINKRHDENANKEFRKENSHDVISITKPIDLVKKNTSIVEETKRIASTTNEEILVECQPKEKEREHYEEKEGTSVSMSNNNSLLPAALLPYAKQKLDYSPTQNKLSSDWTNLQQNIISSKTVNKNNRNKNLYRYAEIEEEEIELEEEEEERSTNVRNFAVDVATGNADIGISAQNAILFVKLEESLERMELERNYWQEFALVATKWGNVWRRRCFLCSSLEEYNQEQWQQEHHNIEQMIGSTKNENARKKRDVDKENDYNKAEKPVQDNFLQSQILAVLGERYDADGTRVLLLHVKETASTEADMNNISNKQRNVQNIADNSIICSVEEDHVDIYKENQNASFWVTVKWMPLALVQNNEVVQRYCNKYDKTYFTLTPTIIQRDEASRPLYSSLQKPVQNKNNVKSHMRCYEEECQQSLLLQSTPLSCSSPDDRLSFESSPFAYMGATERAELEEELRRIPRRTLSPEKVINSSSQPLLSTSTLFRLQKFDLLNEAQPCLSKEMLLVAHDTTINSASHNDQAQNERCNDNSTHQNELLQEEKNFVMEPQAEDIRVNNINQLQENVNNRETREVQTYDIDCISPTHFNSTEKPEICEAVCNTESVICEIDEVDDSYRLVMEKPSHACARVEKNKSDEKDSVVVVIETTNTSNNVRSNNKDNNIENVMLEEQSSNHQYVKEHCDSIKETESSASRRAPRLTHVAAEEPVATNNYIYALDKCNNDNLNTAAVTNNKEEQRLLREQQQQQQQQLTNNNNIDKNADQSAAIMKKDRKQFLSTMEKASYEEFLFHSALEVLERKREKAKKIANTQGAKKGKAKITAEELLIN